jgi:hypothetical protein
MRRILPLVTLVLLGAACDAAARRAPTSPSPGGASMDKGGPPSPDDRLRFIRIEDMEPDFAAYVRRQLSDPEHIRETERAHERQLRAGPLGFAFAADGLPEGAVAAVVRNRSGQARRMLVFSESSITDRAISLARLALMEDEQDVPEPDQERVLLVWADQRVRAGGQIKVKNYNVPSRGRGEASALLRANRLAAVQVETLGRVVPVEMAP